MSVYALIVEAKQLKSATVRCGTDAMRWMTFFFFFFFFTSEIQNHCPGTGRCGLLMYSNVSHWYFFF